MKGQQWRDVIHMQQGWIGAIDGYALEFDLDFHSTDEELQGERLAVFSQEPGIAAASAVNFVSVGPGSMYWNDRFRLVSRNIALYSPYLMAASNHVTTFSQRQNVAQTTLANWS